MINQSLSHSKIFSLAILSFLAGIAMAEIARLDYFFIFCASLFLSWLFFSAGKNFYLKIFILLLAFFILGLWRYQISLPDFSNPKNIYHYNNSQVSFDGRIKNIETKLNYQQLVVEAEAVKNNRRQGLVLLTLPLYPEYQYGDLLKINCQLKEPANYNAFDYRRYLSKSGIYTTCYYPSIIAVEKEQKNFGLKLWSFVYFIKSKLKTSLGFFVREPEASLLQALILGSTAGLPKDIATLFSNVGLSHIIAISGMHMVIITVVIMQLSIAFGVIRQKAFWVAFVAIIFYLAMIGFLPSAVRGAVMALLFLYAQKIGRISYSVNALLLSAFIMLLFNPKLLLADVGFQLSFTAVLGLLYLWPILKEKFKNWPELGPIKNIALATLAAQIMTQPLIIFYFHKISLVALLANLLVLPLAPFLLIWTFINALVGWIFAPLGHLLGYISYLLAHYMISVAAYFNNWPGAYFKLEIESLFLTMVFYLLIIIFIVKNKNFILER